MAEEPGAGSREGGQEVTRAEDEAHGRRGMTDERGEKAKGPTDHMDPSGPSEKAPAATYSPTSNACSTIGSGGLNCRVRDGNGCDPTDKATGKRAGGGTGRPDRPPYVKTGKEEEHRGDRGSDVQAREGGERKK